MNILIVASKFPPEYSGPGVRIPKLYNNIKSDINLRNLYVLCNSSQFSDNTEYDYGICKISRRVPPFYNKKNRLFRMATHFLETIQALRTLKSYNKKNISLVHIIGHSGATSAAIYWAEKHNIPIIMELVNADAQPMQRWMLFQKIRPKKQFVMITIADYLKKRCINAGIEAEKIWSRPNPVDFRRFFPNFEQKQELRRKLFPFNTDDVVLLSIAKFMPRKKQDFLIKVVQLLPQNYQLILAGPIANQGSLVDRDKQYVQDIKNDIKANNLENRVLLITDFVDSAQYMQAADIYLLPGVNEGLGTPMLEAIACGMPVVANNQPAFQEWIKPNNNGFVCELSPEEWKNKIIHAHRFTREQKNKAAQEISLACDHKKIHDKYIKFILKLVKSETFKSH